MAKKSTSIQASKPTTSDSYKVVRPFELWIVQIDIKSGGEGKPSIYSAQKLRKVREVNITEEEADILNSGVLKGNNTYAEMYYPNESYSKSTDDQ